MFVHETLLSLLATSRQQGRNPYEKLASALSETTR